MKSKFAVIVAGAAALFVAADDPPKAQQKQDPQAKFEPRSGPGAGQKLLASFVGEWNVVKTFHPRQGDPVSAKGTCHQAMVQDGRFLQSDFVFEAADGKKTTGQGLIGFEPETEAFTSVWIDSRQTRMSMRQGKEKFDGKTIILYSRTLDPAAKEERKSKTISRLENEGKTLLHRQFSIGANGEERLVMELTMTRKAKAAE